MCMYICTHTYFDFIKNHISSRNESLNKGIIHLIIGIIFLQVTTNYFNVWATKLDDYLRQNMAETTEHFHKWLEFWQQQFITNRRYGSLTEFFERRCTASQVSNTTLNKATIQKWLQSFKLNPHQVWLRYLIRRFEPSAW